jgi:hypothetical protein
MTDLLDFSIICGVWTYEVLFCKARIDDLDTEWIGQ